MSEEIVAAQLAEKAFSTLVTAYKEWAIVHESEQTKREEIRAQRDVAIKRIKSQRAILERYLDGVFSERRVIISGFFETLNNGLDSNNLEVASKALDGIVEIVKTSPLGQVKELIKQTYDPNIKEIEI